MAAPTFFTHNEIAGVINNLIPFEPFMLQFFGREFVTDDKQINFDRIPADRRIAPIVSPLVPGKVAAIAGYRTSVIQPAYIKDKMSIEPGHIFTRRPGEPMGQPMSNAERYAATVMDLGVRALERYHRRLEIMASQLLLYGSYTMTGETASYSVDFERPAANTVTLTSGDVWVRGSTTVSPMQTIQNMLDNCKYPIRTIVMGSYAFAALLADPAFVKLTYNLYAQGQSNNVQFNIAQKNLQGVLYRGTIAASQIEIYTYTGTYIADDGTEQYYIPQDAVVFVPDSSYGWRCFGAIQDVAAGYSGMPYFFKNWMEEDPGTPFLMLQSAPVMAHTRMDSTLGLFTGATQPQGGK